MLGENLFSRELVGALIPNLADESKLLSVNDLLIMLKNIGNII